MLERALSPHNFFRSFSLTRWAAHYKGPRGAEGGGDPLPGQVPNSVLQVGAKGVPKILGDSVTRCFFDKKGTLMFWLR